MSTLGGNHECIRAGDIMSTLGMFSTLQGYHYACGECYDSSGGYHEYFVVFNISQGLLSIFFPT